MASRKVRNRRWAEERIAYDAAIEEGRIAREEREKAEKDIDLEPKKKPVKKANKTSKKGK